LFKNAIVRIPGSNFADGLTTVSLGIPSLEKVFLGVSHRTNDEG